jgi:hypothetical protein
MSIVPSTSTETPSNDSASQPKLETAESAVPPVQASSDPQPDKATTPARRAKPKPNDKPADKPAVKRAAKPAAKRAAKPAAKAAAKPVETAGQAAKRGKDGAAAVPFKRTGAWAVPSGAKLPTKPAKPPVAKDAAAAAPASKAARAKEKLVRDSFTMPRADFALIQTLKERAMGFRHAAKKSELLRAGLHALNRLNEKALQAALESLTPLKTGRPKKAA